MITPVLRKRPNEQYPVGLKFVAPDLALDQAEIVSATVEVRPNTIDGLVLVGSPTIDVDVVTQFIKGGKDNVDYNVIFEVRTSDGNIYTNNILILCRDFD